jgi:hypothetical protein
MKEYYLLHSNVFRTNTSFISITIGEKISVQVEFREEKHKKVLGLLRN